MNRRNIFLWILYDFANSIVNINFFLYFTQWLVIDAGLSSFWFNSIFVGSTILLIFSALPLAAYSDRIKNRKIFLNITTIGTAIFSIATVLVAEQGTQYIWVAAGLYLLVQYFYQFSFVFYNPMIDQLAPLEKRGRVSGWGQSANWLGQIVGLLIALPMITEDRLSPLIPVTIIFLILALPMMIYFKESYEDSDFLPASTGSYLKHFYRFIRYAPAGVFLLSFFFFNDAILTMENNFPIYMEKVFNLLDQTKSILLMTILLTSAIGSYVAGHIADKVGMNKTLKFILFSWIILIPLISLTSSFVLFTIELALVGFFYGATWSVTRAYLSGILPKNEMNYGFSFYTLMERFATFVGPITWGLIIGAFGQSSVFGYRIAALSMTVFVVIGYFILRKIPEYKSIINP